MEICGQNLFIVSGFCKKSKMCLKFKINIFSYCNPFMTPVTPPPRISLNAFHNFLMFNFQPTYTGITYFHTGFSNKIMKLISKFSY